jgi:DNA-binding response OmpR family regulator
MKAVAQRERLAVTMDPPALFWDGRREPAFTATMCRILTPLVRFGRVSYFALACLIGEDSDLNLLKVHVTRIRKAIRAAGLPLAIECEWGWGYRLVIVDA